MELFKKTIIALVVAGTMAQSAEAINLGDVFLFAWKHKKSCILLTVSLCAKAASVTANAASVTANAELAAGLGECQNELDACEINPDLIDCQMKLATIHGYIVVAYAIIAVLEMAGNLIRIVCD